MEQNRLVSSIVMLAVVIICTASILVPVINDAQVTAGTQITKTNDSLSGYYGDYYDEDVTITITSPTSATSAADATIEINSYDVANTGTNTMALVFSTNAYILLNTQSSTTIGLYRLYNDTPGPVGGNFELGHTYTIFYDASESTITLTSVDLSDDTTTIIANGLACHYFFGVKENGAYSYYEQSVTTFANYYVDLDTVDDESVGVFRIANSTTIDNVSVAYIVVMSEESPEVIVPNGYSATVSMDVLNESVVEGTTDIYSGGTPYVNLTITNDNTSSEKALAIVPTQGWILREVEGHADSGAAYSLYGAIPVLIIVSCVIGAIGLISRRD